MRSNTIGFLAWLVIPAVFLLATIGCNKSNGGSSSVTARINGTAWAANIPETGALITTTSQLIVGGIQFKNGDSTEITLTFPSTANTAYDGGVRAGHSTITVTSYDSAGGKVSGTFNGVLYNTSGGSDSLIITDGTFNTTFIKY
jgi:hypothetical protein